MNLPRFPDFKAVGLEDRPYFQEQIVQYPSEACEINFANVFIWRKYERPKYTIIEDNLCVLVEPLDEPAYFLQPIGKSRISETIRICLSAAPRLSRLPEPFIQDYCSEFHSELDRDNFDYVYETADLIYLGGKRYDGKRNRIRKFEKNHAYRYLRLSPIHFDECLRLLEDWFNAKSPEMGLLGAQRDALIETLGHYDSLGLVGGAIESEGRIVAFSISQELFPGTAVIQAEIVNPAYDGLAQLMNREFIKNEWAASRFINREQDLGVPGLRRAKTSYHPHHFVKKYNLTLSS
jgi:hypothetical protein